MRSATVLVLATLLPLGCSANPGQVAPGRSDTGESVYIEVENNGDLHAMIGFTYGRDAPIPLGRVEPGEEQNWTIGWQDDSLRIEIDRQERRRSMFSQAVDVEPNDTVHVVLLTDSRMTTSVRE